MNTWKMLSGLVSMVAAAAVLTSVLTTYKNFNDSTFQPSGLIILALAALFLGLAGIVQIVFRDGLIEKARLVTVGLFAVAAVLFLVTAVVAFLDFNGWVQLITFIVWSVGCAAFAYVDYMWAYKISDSHMPALESVDDDEDEDVVSVVDEAGADSEQSVDDIPALPDVDETSGEGTPLDTTGGDLSWDGVSGPPPRIG